MMNINYVCADKGWNGCHCESHEAGPKKKKKITEVLKVPDNLDLN